MARPKADFPDPVELRRLIDGEGRLCVRVTPGARSDGVSLSDGAVAVKVRVKPEDGKATEAVRALLAEALGVAPSQVELLRGATSRQKQFRIRLG